MSCERALAAFASVDGLPSDVDAQHIRHCPDCQRAANGFQVAIKDLQDATRSTEDGHFVAEVMRKTRAPRASGTKHGPRIWGALAASAMLAVSVAYWRSQAVLETDFVARGNMASGALHRAPVLETRRHPHGQPNVFEPLMPGSAIQPQDGFSFRIVNETGQQWYASVFAIDAAREVHWFFPAWTESSQRPDSIRVAAQPRIQRLAEGVTPEDVAIGPLSLCAVFSATPIQAAWIEQQLSSGGLEGLASALPAATIQHIFLSVTP
jgi:hypothetical protein